MTEKTKKGQALFDVGDKLSVCCGEDPGPIMPVLLTFFEWALGCQLMALGLFGR